MFFSTNWPASGRNHQENKLQRMRLLLFSALLLLPGRTDGARIASGKRGQNRGRARKDRRPGSESRHNEHHGPPVYKVEAAPSQEAATDERNLQFDPVATCQSMKCMDSCLGRCKSKISSYLDSKWYHCDAYTHDGNQRIEPPMKMGSGKGGSGGNCGSMGQCSGDCDSDMDCSDGLKCFERSEAGGNAAVPVPGCSVGPEGVYPSVDFCYDENAGA
jgi:hypothetical protein